VLDLQSRHRGCDSGSIGEDLGVQAPGTFDISAMQGKSVIEAIEVASQFDPPGCTLLGLGQVELEAIEFGQAERRLIARRG
jgi:hypothetical protein